MGGSDIGAPVVGEKEQIDALDIALPLQIRGKVTQRGAVDAAEVEGGGNGRDAVGLELEDVEVIIGAKGESFPGVDPHLLAGSVVAGVGAAVAVSHAQPKRMGGGKFRPGDARNNDDRL